MGHKVSNRQFNLWACCKPSLYLSFIVINSAPEDDTSVHRWSLIWEINSVEELYFKNFLSESFIRRLLIK